MSPRPPLSEIVDGQLHELGPRSSTAVDDLATRMRIMLETTVSAMDAVGVNAALLHPLDSRMAEPAVAEFPERFGVVLTLDPTAPDISDQVTHIRERPGIYGIRIIAAFPPSGEELRRFDEGGYDPMIAAAERAGVPLFFFISGHLPKVEPLLRRFPELKLIIDHLGIRQPPLDPRDDPPFLTIPQLTRLARYPNVAVKLCGVPALSSDGYPYADTWPHVHELLEHFGVERVFWASDIPRFQGRISWDFKIEHAWKPYDGGHTYADSLAFIRDSDQLSASEKEQLLGRTIRRLIDWPAPAPS